MKTSFKVNYFMAVVMVALVVLPAVAADVASDQVQPRPKLVASAVQPEPPSFVPLIEPPIAIGMQPATCYAPGTDPRVVEANAARALFEQLAISLAVPDGDRYNINNRWTTTATNGSGLGQGDPTVITWRVVPDGVSIPGFNGEPAGNSNLRSFLNGIYGSEATWLPIFQSIFDNWSALTGFDYVYESADDSAAFSNVSTTAPGVLGVRADIRIGGHFIDGNSNILAYNFYPNNGEMVIDTGDNFYSNTSNNSLGMRNVLAHEHGHGMGLLHVCPISQTKLMEPFVSFAFDGPQHDDILAANRSYGDGNEHNDTPATSTDQGTPGSTTINLSGLSIDDVADDDHFSFTVGGGTDIDVTVTPVGSTYLSGTQNGDGSCSAGSSYNSLDNQNLKIEILDLNGTTVVASANSNGAGLGELLTGVVLSSGAGKYWVRITGTSAADPQLYTMSLTIRDGGVGPATGACCAGDGSCSELTASACTSSGGVYQGDGTTCGGVSCPVSSVLYDQTASASTGGSAIQDFETANDAYDAEGADDFEVLDPTGWDVTEVSFRGFYSSGGGPVSQAHVTIYGETTPGTPGTAVCSHSSLPVSIDGANLAIALPAVCHLDPGTYWLSVQPDMDFTPFGQIYWTRQTVQAGSPAVWRNPGNGFATGCTSWGLLSTCLATADADLTFQVIGSVGVGASAIFDDGFESGNTSAWTSVTP